MDFQSAMETFAEAWVAANTKTTTPLQNQALALTRDKSPPLKCESRESADRGATPAPPRSVTPLADTESLVSPPSIKDGFDLSKSSTGKSLPVHCIVEAVCSLEEGRSIHHHTQWRRRPVVETDSYVIIPVATPFHDLVQVALMRLGYSTESAAAAKGSVIIKNWKALSFDQITDDPLVTVGDILGELSTVATLRIQLFRSRPGALADIKDKLLRFLLVQSHGLLLSAGCPLDELVLSQICRGGNGSPNAPEPSEDCRRKFDQWWASQLIPQVRPQSGGPFTSQFPVTPASKPLERVSSISNHEHPAMQTVHTQYPTQKTRMRTSFDPELELPKLQRWFADNQHPSRQQIQHYVKELNSLESRRGRKPLDVNNVVYWFKNARAAQKRAEIRSIPPGLSCHLNVNGYNNHSPTNGAGLLLTDGYLASERMSDHHKNSMAVNYRRGPQMGMMCDDMSNAGSDIDDEAMMEQRTDEDQALSPRPLSLTTSRKEERDSPRPSTPPPPVSEEQDQDNEPKSEPKEEQEHTHSPSDKSNNNKIMSVSEAEYEDMEADDESKYQSEGSSAVSPLSRQPQQSRQFCGSPDMDGQLMPRIPTDGLERLTAGFPMVPNSMFSHSIMYMSHYIPSLTHGGHANISATSPSGSAALGISALAASAAADERRKRNRTFIDPVTEVPRLEQWFSLNTHPSHSLILKYTEDLNCMAYRQKFPRLEPKNVQFWFKNRRAKCKRLKMSLFDNQAPSGHQYQQSDRE